MNGICIATQVINLSVPFSLSLSFSPQCVQNILGTSNQNPVASRSNQNHTAIMSYAFQIAEPHPSASASRRPSGRFGAGNLTRTPPILTQGFDAPVPPSISPTSFRRQQNFAARRGGAANTCYLEELAIFSFDEELQQQLRRVHVAPVYHIGRGCAGNATYNSRVRRKDSEADNVESPVESAVESDAESPVESPVEIGADVGARNLKRGLQNGWGKVVGVDCYMMG